MSKKSAVNPSLSPSHDPFREISPSQTRNIRPIIIDREVVDEGELCPECGTPLQIYLTPYRNTEYAECPGCGYCES